MEQKWWHNAVIYQVYPKSFKDSNGDGVGDIRGIIDKLDYLQSLGIGIIWIFTCFNKPSMLIRGMVDHQVHNDFDLAFMAFCDQFLHIFHATKDGGNILVIRDVIAVIIHGTLVDW